MSILQITAKMKGGCGVRFKISCWLCWNIRAVTMRVERSGNAAGPEGANHQWRIRPELSIDPVADEPGRRNIRAGRQLPRARGAPARGTPGRNARRPPSPEANPGAIGAGPGESRRGRFDRYRPSTVDRRAQRPRATSFMTALDE